MTNTVTMLANHKGITKPRVAGDEYVVDASIDVIYTVNGETITAASLGLSTITAATITGISSVSLDGGYLALPYFIETNTSGGYESSTSFQLVFKSGGNTDPINGTRVRVWGQI